MFYGGVSVHEIAFWPLSSLLLLSSADGHNGPLQFYIQCGQANGERGAREGRLSYRVSRLEAS